MIVRRVIIFPVLCAYILLTAVAGMGRVVICHDVGGGIAIETEGATCCCGETTAGPEVAEQVVTATSCSCCTDIPVGDTSTVSIANTMAKAFSAGGPPAVLLAWAHITLTSGIEGFLPSVSHDTRAGAPELILQSIILRC